MCNIFFVYCRFDVTKPWSLGVFLTCQVRLEQPANRQQQQQHTVSLAASTATVIGAGAAAVGDAATAGSQRLSGSGSSSTSGLPARGSSDGGNKDTGSGSSSPTPQQQQQLVMQLVDFGFVSTSATIAVREAGSQTNKRMEKSWEHAVVSGAAAMHLCSAGTVLGVAGFGCRGYVLSVRPA